MNETTLVIGHLHPDMDAIASAAGYAWLLAQTGGDFVAGRTGQVNAQTDFALGQFGMEAPALVTDVRARVGDLLEHFPSLTTDSTILDACQSIASTRRSAALLDADRKPVGLITGAALFATMGEALSSTSVLALAREFDDPARKAADSGSTIFSREEFIRDVLNQVLRAEQDDFIVVDEDGRYAGLSRKSRLLSPPRRRLVLVDHNEPGQAVAGIEEAEIIEVLDHHRLSSMPTAAPIRFRIEPVGSCSTLVAERGIEQKINFPAPLAGLLLCGILSDTLIFRSPTSTPRDPEAARHLARMAKLVTPGTADEATDAAITELGNALLAAGAGLGSRPGEEIVGTDIKYYEVNGAQVAMAQVEVGHLRELEQRLPDLKAALQKMIDEQKLRLAVLMVTDVVRGNSRLVVAGHPRLISALPYARLNDDTLDAPGLMSRKKQLVPTVLAVLSQSV
ncbi:MAG: DHH family phosphoesterase [Anaerolineae bacterium]|jgi:manganese-dependent inorganic pyrophosphatase|nr:DHH family phosphoesterase [Anaerolineae bacterium]